MSLRDTLVETFEDEVTKQNPWQPYRGDAGGEGWQNLITGEIRYQDQRPGAQEGMPEDYEGEIPTPEGEVPDALSEIEIHPSDVFEAGDEVTFEDLDGGTELDAEIVGNVESDTGPLIEDENGEQYQATWEEIQEDPREEYVADQPPDGWADNWDEPPDDPEDLRSGQTVEIYDREEGVYKEGEVETLDEWDEGMYVSVRTEDSDIYEFLDGEPTGSGEGSLMTAVEDLVDPDVMGLQPDEIDTDLKGMETAVYNERTGEIVEGEIETVSANMNEVGFTSEDGQNVIAGPNSAWSVVSEEGLDEIALWEAETIDTMELQPDDATELGTFHEGALAEIEHPAEGSVTGEVRIVDHGEKGRHLYVGDSEVGTPLDDPEHPLAQVEIGDVESQWIDLEQTDEMEQEFGIDDAPVDLGDEVFYGGETYQVTAVDGMTGEIELDGGEVTWSADEAASLAQFTKPVDMPDDPYEAAWETGLPDSFKPEDSVAFLTEGGKVEADSVVEDYNDGTIETYDHGVVEDDQIRVWADTGKPAANQVDPGDIHSGSAVTIVEAQSDGSTETFEAYITEADTYGVPRITAVDAEGDVGHYELDEQTYGVVDHDMYADAGDVIETVGDWQNYEADEMVDEFYDQVVSGRLHDNYLSKRLIKGETPAIWWFFKEKQEQLRTNFMQHFPPDEVEGFYESISNWKMASGSDSKNRQLEEAFRSALGIESRVRGEHEDAPRGPGPPDAWVKMAEVAGKMSQRYYEEVVMPNTGGQLTRDCAATSLKSFMLEWAENPDADEFGFDGRALNNFQINPGKWNDWRVTPSDVGPESIGLATDFMFNPMETNRGEDEIWVIPDEVTVAPDQVGIGDNRSDLSTDGHFGGDIADWTDNQVQAVSQEIAQYYEDLTVDESEVYRPDELSDQQVETFLRVAERAGEVGITDGGVSNWVNLVEAEAVERGISAPDAPSEHPILDSPEQLPEGTEVRVMDHGEPISGEVLGSEGDQLNVRNVDTGHEADFNLADVSDVVWAPEKYGDPANVDLTDFDVDEFEPLDEVYIWSGGDWEEGKVLEVDEDETVEVSLDTEHGGTDYFDEYEIQNANYVVPQDMVETGTEEYPDPGSTVEIDVPDDVDYDANAIMAEVDSVDPDGSLNVGYDEIPWLEHSGSEALADTVNVEPGEYEAASEPSATELVEEHGGGNFSTGTTVPIHDEHGFPNAEVTIGDPVDIDYVDGHGTVVDITSDHHPKVYIEDADHPSLEAGDVETLYPSDEVSPSTVPDDFGAITDGFDSVDEADAYTDDPVEYLDPETGDVVEGTMTATFPSMNAVHVDGVDDPVHYEHVRPSDPPDEGIGHDDLDLGSNVVVEHFDPGVGTTEGTVIGFNDEKMNYIVDLNSGEGQPAPSEMIYVGTHEVEDIKGEGEVNGEAVQVVSDNPGFTQDLPGGSPDLAAGEPLDESDFEDIETGDYIMVDVSGSGQHEPAEVHGQFSDGSHLVEFDDGSTKEIRPDTALDLYHAEDPATEGSDESLLGFDDVGVGDTVTFETGWGLEYEGEVVHEQGGADTIQVELGSGETMEVYEGELEDVTEGSDL